MTPQFSTEQQQQQQQQQESTSHASLYFHDGRDSQNPGSQTPAALWPGQSSAAKDSNVNKNSLFSSDGPTIILHPPVQRSDISIHDDSMQHQDTQSCHEGQSQGARGEGRVTGHGHGEMFDQYLHNATLNTSTGEFLKLPTVWKVVLCYLVELWEILITWLYIMLAVFVDG